MRRRLYDRYFLYGTIAFFALIYSLPAYMAIVTALKYRKDIVLAHAWNLPIPFTFHAFSEAFKLLLPNVVNSIILTVTATIISALIGSINGYVFSKYKFPGSEIIFVFLLLGMFIPYQIILIPLFSVLNTLHLTGSLIGLIVTHVVYGISIVTLIFRGFYDRIPQEIIESGSIDGAGFFTIYLKLMLPLVMNGFIVVSIWQFTQIWNEFLWGTTLTGQSSQPITVKLAQLAGGQAVAWNLTMAGAFISALPVLLIYIFLGKYFISGLLAGSVKG
ncbi:hypothetical protein LSH36_583g02246 [Paralvinella palmiformis]|uniref:ABC transmembrane type-1 domain-containing protein n=1 Tax=Paralvinella palmiformis TaxID=53620 RepID=A0AAD9MWX6_9ANNE|nr:hypothetical protein LSH36_583g02246 [Paralvinella palmiformis]